LTDYVWYNELSRQFMENDYLRDGETLDTRVDAICGRAGQLLGDPTFAARFKANLEKGWYSLSTPIWVNFGTERGLPISCFGSSIEDSMDSILYTQAEVGMMTKLGGGTSAYFGHLRPRGAPITGNGESAGAVHFMQLFDNVMNVVSQGATRRGNFAAYLPIDHPDIAEFLKIRSEGFPIQDLSFGVCIPDAWMEEMIAGDEEKRAIWAGVLASRANTGFPYLFFVDNANKQAPEWYRDRPITHSNLCSEIVLPDNKEESFVCCLSSMNILHYEAWKETDAVALLVAFLDAVLTEFIRKAEHIPFMDRAVRFAERHRALGIGWIGWHSFLQSKGIPFEGLEAMFWNRTVAGSVQAQATAASEQLAAYYGEPEVLKGHGRRNSTLMAIAPTKSSSFILGQVSEGIEPVRANIQVKDLAKGKFTLKNRYLEERLAALGKDDPETWRSIMEHGGSVQHLEWLSERDRAVFRTFAEISPMTVVQQAAQRQQFIDQGQSLNLMIHPLVPVKDLNALIIEGWRLGIKSFYYQISVNAAQELSRSILTCSSCEG
jgi:ribonucleoside-diphosphate reductase alpha chain